jgi:16S rRNA (uracil1498-N3)-methyltransferase
VRLPRFYFEGELSDGATLELPEPVARHVRVLRMRAGDAVVLFDGRRGEFEANLTAVGRSGVRARLGARREIEREPPLRVTLVQGVSSGERMDLTIQKAVELGVAAIQPVLTARSVVRLNARRGAAKLEHWRRIAIAACEQCGRNRIPPIHAPLSLAEYCRHAPPAELRLLLSPEGERSLKAALSAAPGELVLAAGPEGGFSAEEQALLAAAGFIAVRLGPRVLRTETAAPAALAALNALSGEY